MLIHTVEDEARGCAVTRGKTAALKYPEREKKETDERNDVKVSNMSQRGVKWLPHTTMIKELRQIATKYYSLINRI